MHTSYLFYQYGSSFYIEAWIWNNNRLLLAGYHEQQCCGAKEKQDIFHRYN
jgi:hypothetical protein